MAISQPRVSSTNLEDTAGFVSNTPSPNHSKIPRSNIFPNVDAGYSSPLGKQRNSVHNIAPNRSSGLSIDPKIARPARGSALDKAPVPNSPISNPQSQTSMSSHNLGSPSTAPSSINLEDELPSGSPVKEQKLPSAKKVRKSRPYNFDREESKSPSRLSLDGTNRLSGRTRKPTSKAQALANAGTRFYKGLQRKSDEFSTSGQTTNEVAPDSVDLELMIIDMELESMWKTEPERPSDVDPPPDNTLVNSVEAEPTTSIRSSPRQRKPTAKAIAAETELNTRKRTTSPTDSSRPAKIAKTSTSIPKEPSKLRQSISSVEDENQNEHFQDRMVELSTRSEDKSNIVRSTKDSNPKKNKSVERTLEATTDLSGKESQALPAKISPTKISLVVKKPETASRTSQVSTPLQETAPLTVNLSENNLSHSNRDAIRDGDLAAGGSRNRARISLPAQSSPVACKMDCLSSEQVILAFARFAADEPDSEDGEQAEEPQTMNDSATSSKTADSILSKVANIYCQCTNNKAAVNSENNNSSKNTRQDSRDIGMTVPLAKQQKPTLRSTEKRVSNKATTAGTNRRISSRVGGNIQSNEVGLKAPASVDQVTRRASLGKKTLEQRTQADTADAQKPNRTPIIRFKPMTSVAQPEGSGTSPNRGLKEPKAYLETKPVAEKQRVTASFKNSMVDDSPMHKKPKQAMVHSNRSQVMNPPLDKSQQVPETLTLKDGLNQNNISVETRHNSSLSQTSTPTKTQEKITKPRSQRSQPKKVSRRSVVLSEVQELSLADSKILSARQNIINNMIDSPSNVRSGKTANASKASQAHERRSLKVTLKVRTNLF